MRVIVLTNGLHFKSERHLLLMLLVLQELERVARIRTEILIL